MASRRAQPSEHSQNPRFSWQLPLEDLSQRPLQIDTTNVHHHHQQQQRVAQNQTENRYSWMETPVEAQNPTFARPAEPRRPSGPGMSPIPQSPETPIEPGVAQRQSLMQHQQRHSSTPHSHLHIQTQPQPQPQQQHYEYPDEKKSHFPAPQAIHPSEYISPSPSSALHSPIYPPIPSSPPPAFQAHPNTYNNPPTPHSPGALPSKTPYHNPDLPSPITPTTRSMPPTKDPTYIPHTNTLLKSPTSPIFSPDSLSHPSTLPGAGSTSAHTQPRLPNHQPGQIAHPNMDHGAAGEQRRWRHEMCGCCGEDVGTCVEGFMCPCVVYGRTAYRLGMKSQKKDPTDLLGWRRFRGTCLVVAVTCGLCGLLPGITRTRVRHAYHLAGSVPSDIIRGCCCCCCVIVQNELEVKDREDSSRRWAGPGAGEAYATGEQMVYAPPPRG